MTKRITAAAALFFAMTLTLGARNLVIMHTNDTHSHIDPVRGGSMEGRAGVIERAAFIDSLRAAEGKKNVLLLDAGDFSQGSSYFTLLKGFLEVDLLNAMGYDVACLGNHEFDNGMDQLAERLRKAKFDVVCANYNFYKTPLDHVVKHYSIVRRGGLKIGIVGVLTDVRRVVDVSVARHLRYLDPVLVINYWARVLKEEKKCDMVICLSHLGYETDCAVAPKIRNVDLVVGGHSHTDLTEPTYVNDATGKPLMIVQDGCWGTNVGLIRTEGK